MVNLTQPSSGDVSAFLAAVSDSRRRADAQTVLELMIRATGEAPVMWGSAIVGFGQRHYVYDSGREDDTFIVGFAPRKSALTLYGLHGAYETLGSAHRIGSHTTGKGCLYFKNLDEVDLTELERVVGEACAPRK